MKRYFKNKSFIVSISILSLLLIVLFASLAGVSYAYFVSTSVTDKYVVYTGNLSVDYIKKTSVISIDNAYPMTNEEGLKQTSHDFIISNTGTIDARYQVRLELDSDTSNSIDISYIKLSYKIDDGTYSEPVLLSNLNSSLVFIKDKVLKPNTTNTISIKLWIDINADNDIQKKEFKARVVVDSIQNVEDGYVVDTNPIITLNKNTNNLEDINLKVGDTYNELGVLKVEDDKDILTPNDVSISYEYYDTNNLTTVSSIDTSKIGVYYVTYSVTDSSNNTSKKVRVVTVNNSDSIPNISLIGNSEVNIYQSDTYTEEGVSVEDNNSVITLGEVKTNTVGTYIIRYIVVDSNGNLSSVVRTVNVKVKTFLSDLILNNNTLVTDEPTITTSSNNTSDASGLYKSTATNDGSPTYYFRGAVENNYVSFAGYTWRIVRINEDGTIRLIMANGINNSKYAFNSSYNDYSYMYYSNSEAKTTLEDWYNTNLSSYSDYIATGDYFCEQAKVTRGSNSTSGSAEMTEYTSYTPNFNCSADGNEKGIVNASIGLITYDEVVYAGGYYNQSNSSYYLYTGSAYWTMSPTGFTGSYVHNWFIKEEGFIDSHIINYLRGYFYPVINLNADTPATGTGTSSDPYVIG